MSCLKMIFMPVAFCISLLIVPHGLIANIFEDVQSGNLGAVKKYINNNKSAVMWVDVNDDTLLHYAVVNRHKEIVRFLLESGADIEARDQCLCTPFTYALINGYEEIMKLLLEKGAQVCYSDLEYLSKKIELIKSIFGMKSEDQIGSCCLVFKKWNQKDVQKNELSGRQSLEHCLLILSTLLCHVAKNGVEKIASKDDDFFLEFNLNKVCQKFVLSLKATNLSKNLNELKLDDSESLMCKKFFKMTPMQFFEKRTKNALNSLVPSKNSFFLSNLKTSFNK